MNVLSLFDGISCARVALDKANIPIATYYASEIDLKAIEISKKNYPDIVHIGDVQQVKGFAIDLLIGGSPCQDLSIAKKDRKGLEGDRSGLFWEYVRIKKECNPKWFILENVASMPQTDKEIITREMGVEPILFNASLVSAQCRKRLFWTNIPFMLPEDHGIVLKDILQPEVDQRFVINGKSITLSSKRGLDTKKKMLKIGYIGKGEQYGQGGQAHRIYDIEGKTPTLSSFSPLIKIGHIGNSNSQANRVYDPEGKSVTLSANGGGLGAKTGLYQTHDKIRKLTPIECERLQGLPDNYTEGIAITHRYKCLGNAFNADVIAHIVYNIHTSLVDW